jgi:sortase A
VKRASALRGLERLLLVSGMLLLVAWGRVELGRRGYQAAASARFDADRGVSTPAATAPTSRDARDSHRTGVLGRIEIPRLRLSAMIDEGADVEVLDRAVGHIASTALPGGPGNCGLAGHRDTFLRGLGRLRENDVVRIVTLDGTTTYRVRWAAVVSPGRSDLLAPTDLPSLTLVTCYPFHVVGPAPDRYVVRAIQAGSSTGS